MVKNKTRLTGYWLFGAVLLFAFSASAQRADVKEDEAYYLPGLVSDKTIPLYAEKFSKLDGVVVKAYCLSSETLVVEIDRGKQQDNLAVEEAIRSVFNATSEMLPMTAQKKFNTEEEISDCPQGKDGERTDAPEQYRATTPDSCSVYTVKIFTHYRQEKRIN